MYVTRHNKRRRLYRSRRTKRGVLSSLRHGQRFVFSNSSSRIQYCFNDNIGGSFRYQRVSDGKLFQTRRNKNVSVFPAKY